MTTIRWAKRGKAALAACGIAASVLALPASAADWGVGVLFNGSGSGVLVPIRLQTLIIEPEVTLSTHSSDSQDSWFTILGTGIYLRKELGPLFEAYYGGRVGYLYSKSDNTGATPDSKTSSFFISPTFGVQHFLSKQFSLGLDVGLQYNINNRQSPDEDAKDLGTVTRVVLRAYF